jgi:smad nuclear-interacting protein 1
VIAFDLIVLSMSNKSRDENADRQRVTRNRDGVREGGGGGDRKRGSQDYYGDRGAAMGPRHERSRSRDRADVHSKKTGRGNNRDNADSGGRAVWGNIPQEEELEKKRKVEDDEREEVKAKANFGLSGALAKDELTGNLQNGVVLKFNEPLDAAVPTKHWRLYVFKGDEIAEALHIHDKSVYLFGRDKRVADIELLHPASSKQHAVIQFRRTKSANGQGLIKPYLMDLQSVNQTFLNGIAIEDSRYYELREQDALKFGLSDREYVLMCAN